MLQDFFKVLSIMFFLGVTLQATNQEDEGKKLFEAVHQNNFEEVKILVESGANVNARDKIGYTPLLTVANTDNLEIFKYLVEHGADINARVNSKFGVLHKASMNKNPIILKYLLEEYTLNTNDRGKRYCSPLDFSLRNNALQNNGTLENAQLLLAHGAKKSINWKCNGYTPLMVAVPNVKVIRFLIENGADIDIRSRAGKTAYDMAKEQKASMEILKLLKGKAETSEDEKIVFIKDNLIWELKTFENKYKKYSQQEAKDYCANLILDNKKGWRVPTALEYKTILSQKAYEGFVIDGIGSYYLDPKEFPNMTPSRYWTILKDDVWGYQDISWNKTHKAGNSAKYHIRCLYTNSKNNTY